LSSFAAFAARWNVTAPFSPAGAGGAGGATHSSVQRAVSARSGWLLARVWWTYWMPAAPLVTVAAESVARNAPA
jgi:hypothetical protein